MSNNPQILSSHLMKLMSASTQVEQVDPMSQDSGGLTRLGDVKQEAKSSQQSMYETLGSVADKVTWGLRFGAQLASDVETAREKSYKEWASVQQGKLDSIETGNIIEDELVIGETSYTKAQLQAMSQTERVGLARKWSQTMINELAKSDGDPRHIAWYQGKDEAFQSEEGSVRRTERNEEATIRSNIIEGMLTEAPIEPSARLAWYQQTVMSEDEAAKISTRLKEDPYSVNGTDFANLQAYNRIKHSHTKNVSDIAETNIKNTVNERIQIVLGSLNPESQTGVQQVFEQQYGITEQMANADIQINGQTTTLATEVRNFQASASHEGLKRIIKGITLSNPDHSPEEYEQLERLIDAYSLNKTESALIANSNSLQVKLNNDANANASMQDGKYSEAFLYRVGSVTGFQIDAATTQWFDNIPDNHIEGVVSSINNKEFFTPNSLKVLKNLPEARGLIQSRRVMGNDILYVNDKDYPKLQQIMYKRYENSKAFKKRITSVETTSAQEIKIDSQRKGIGHSNAKFNYHKTVFRSLAQDAGADTSFLSEALSDTLLEMYPSVYGDIDWGDKSQEEQDRIHLRNMDLLYQAVISDNYESFKEEFKNISPDQIEKARDNVYEYIGLNKETAKIIRDSNSERTGIDNLGVTEGRSSGSIVPKSVLENPSPDDISTALQEAAQSYAINKVSSTPEGKDRYERLVSQIDAGVQGAQGNLNALLKPHHIYFNGKGFPSGEELGDFLNWLDTAYKNSSFKDKAVSYIEDSRTKFKTREEAMQEMASAGIESGRISLANHMSESDPIGSGRILNRAGEIADVPSVGDDSYMRKPSLNKAGTSPFNPDGTLVNRVDAVNNQRHSLYIFDIGERLREGATVSKQENDQYEKFINEFAGHVDILRDASLQRMREGQENFDYSGEQLQSLVLLHQMYPVIRAQFYGKNGNVDPNAPGFKRPTGERRSKASASKYLNQVLISSRFLNRGLVEVKADDVATVSQRDMARMIKIANRPFILDEATFGEMETAMLLAGERTTPITAIAGAGGFITDKGYTGIGYYLTNPELKMTSGSEDLGLAVTNSLTMDLGIPSQDFSAENLSDMLLNQVVGPTMAPAFGMTDLKGATDEAAFVKQIEFQVVQENGDTEMVRWENLTVAQQISIGIGAIQGRFKNNYTQQENKYTQQIQRTLIQNLVDNFKSKELQEVLGIRDTSSPAEKVSAFLQYSMMASNLGDAPGMFITAPYTTQSSINRVTENKDGTTNNLGDKQITTTSFNTYPAVAGWSGSNVYGVVGVPKNADYNTTVKKAFLFSTATQEFKDRLLTSDIPEDQRKRFNEVIGSTVGYKTGERPVTNADILYGYAQVFGTQEDVFGRLQFGTGEGKASGKGDITGGSTRQINVELPTITVQAEQNLRDNKKPVLRITGQDAFELEDVFINPKGNPDYDPTSERSYLKARDLRLSQEQIDYILNGDKDFPEDPRGTLTRMGQVIDAKTDRLLGMSTGI